MVVTLAEFEPDALLAPVSVDSDSSLSDTSTLDQLELSYVVQTALRELLESDDEEVLSPTAQELSAWTAERPNTGLMLSPHWKGTRATQRRRRAR